MITFRNNNQQYDYDQKTFISYLQAQLDSHQAEMDKGKRVSLHKKANRINMLFCV